MEAHVWLKKLCFIIIIFLISAYGGIELGVMEFWQELQFCRKIWIFLFGCGSFLLGWQMIMRTLKNEGRVNLLWLALPVPVLMIFDLFLRSVVCRVTVMTVLLMTVFLGLWFWKIKEH